MKRLAEFIVLISIVAFCAVRINYSQSISAQWTRVESENKEFSCLLPSGFSVALDKEGFSRSSPRNWQDNVNFKNVRSLGGYSDGIAVFLEVYDVKDTKKGLAFITESLGHVSIDQMQFENFTIRLVKHDGDETSGSLYIASKSQIYLVGYAARNVNDPSLARFLAAIRLNDKPIFSTKIDSFPELATVSPISLLNETPTEIVEELITKKDEKESKQKTDQPVSMPQSNGPKSPTSNPDKLTILMKPYAQYTDRARQANEQGIIRLRIAFLANGHIGKITVLKKLRFGLLENVIRVAKRIKFIPAAKDNVAIDMEKIVEYNFSIY